MEFQFLTPLLQAPTRWRSRRLEPAGTNPSVQSDPGRTHLRRDADQAPQVVLTTPFACGTRWRDRGRSLSVQLHRYRRGGVEERSRSSVNGIRSIPTPMMPADFQTRPTGEAERCQRRDDRSSSRRGEGSCEYEPGQALLAGAWSRCNHGQRSGRAAAEETSTGVNGARRPADVTSAGSRGASRPCPVDPAAGMATSGRDAVRAVQAGSVKIAGEARSRRPGAEPRRSRRERFAPSRKRKWAHYRWQQVMTSTATF